ncbi:hypothetical protein AVEN_164622-1 [Araneus ventricosus]|uniref:Uncharacterized protein n=1 Tax=Araneus ventricosus TaxID=182803 RepID=A0A4Y2P3D9_ARAVE|nr:hypothetical protein AVEN_164622-1 [Araneus ventricosus]
MVSILEERWLEKTLKFSGPKISEANGEETLIPERWAHLGQKGASRRDGKCPVCRPMEAVLDEGLIQWVCYGISNIMPQLNGVAGILKNRYALYNA